MIAQAGKKRVTEKPLQSKSNARLAVVQALYQMEATGVGVEAVIGEFRDHGFGGAFEDRTGEETDEAFFADLLRGVVQLQKRIDPQIEKRLARQWTLSRLDATARAILRAAAFEFIHRAEIPAVVIINEYVEIANAFFDNRDPKFINAVLDRMAKELRDEDFAPSGQMA